MGSDNVNLTPERAREQLAVDRERPLHSAADRRVHAIAVGGFGAAMGLLFATQNMFSGGTSSLVRYGVFLVGYLTLEFWVERTVRTVPRRVRLWRYCGIGASLPVALFAVLPWLNFEAQRAPNTWPMVLAGALVIAAPSLLAATVIARGRK